MCSKSCAVYSSKIKNVMKVGHTKSPEFLASLETPLGQPASKRSAYFLVPFLELFL